MGPFGTGEQRICAVVAASTAVEMSNQLAAASKEARTIELRLDWLRTDSERSRFLHGLKRSRRQNTTLIATCRRRIGGGRLPGDAAEELYWLMQAREAGCLWCDLELETYRELPEASLHDYPLPERILLSIHDFERTPKFPRKIRVPSNGFVDAVKIAVKARTIGDSVRLLRLTRRSKGLVAVPMGDAGLPARILALREGSALAYAPVANATAPGQVSLDEMKHLYRAHTLTRRTHVYGVIGDPVGHSLSPLLHNTGFAARRLDAVYLPFLVHKLHDFLATVPEFSVRGFSVTLPHKQAILEHLKACEPLAEEIGAVNTVVVRTDGSLYGCNTDYVGVLRALQKRLRIKGSRVLVFGAGGSARAAAFALSRAGAVVGICARREKAARELARSVGGEALPRRALRTEFFDAVVNATPVGMHPHDRTSPLAPGELHCHILMDLIYRPEKTRLLRMAVKKGIAAMSGVEVFLAQGIAQWEIWTQRRAPEAAMRRAVLSALRAEEKSRNSG